MTIPVSNLLIKQYAPGKWHFTHNAQSEEDLNKTNKQEWMDRAFPKYGGGGCFHLVDAEGDELASRVILQNWMPGFVEHASWSSAGRIWEADVLAFVYRPSSEKQYAVIVPWWGFESRLVVSLDSFAPLTTDQYDEVPIAEQYRNVVKEGVRSAAKRTHTKADNPYRKPKAAELYAAETCFIHHAGMLQMTELKEPLQVLKAIPLKYQDGFEMIHRKAAAALHHLGLNEEKALCDAAAAGDVTGMKEAISKGADVNWGKYISYHVPNVPGVDKLPLECAVESGCVEAVQLLLQVEGIDPNARAHHNGMTALHRAATLDVLEALLKDPRVNPNGSGRGQTPLQVFCAERETALVENMLAQGADPDKTSGWDGACLHAACSAGRLHNVRVLLRAGCDRNLKSFKMNKTALYVAVEKGHTEIVRAILEHEDVDVNSRPKDRHAHMAQPGDPALLVACISENVEIVRLLLQCPGLDSATVGMALGEMVKCSHDALRKPVATAVEWLRNNDPNLGNVDQATVEAFFGLTGVPVPQHKMEPNDRKAYVEDAVDWLRNNIPDYSKLDNTAAEGITNLAGVPMPSLEAQREMIQVFLSCDATTREHLDEALKVAIETNLPNSKEMVSFLLQDHRATSETVHTALEVASSAKKLDLVELLLGHDKMEPKMF